MDSFDLITPAFAALNGLRLLAFVPQIAAVARSRDGARDIALSTWSVWLCCNLTGAAYFVQVRPDAWLAATFAGAALACGAVLGLALRLRLGPRGRALGRRLACLAVTAIVFAFVYGTLNHLTGQRSDVGRWAFDWERAIPFVPWSIVPYLSIVALFVAAFFAVPHPGQAARLGRQLLCTLGLAALCFAAFPQAPAFERPATAGLAGALFELLAYFDRPFNRLPSLHVAVLVLLWPHLAGPLRPHWRWLLHGWCALVAVSVLTTFQHHVIDIAAGIAVAFAGARAGQRPWRRAKPAAATVAGGDPEEPRCRSGFVSADSSCCRRSAGCSTAGAR